MIVGLNCGCPTRMRAVCELLVKGGYVFCGTALLDPGQESARAIRIDTDAQQIRGKNKSYPGRDGDMYGCDVCIDLFRRTA